MSFVQQLVQLLTESPGSIVYHLITLMAMQVVLGIALWQWRRNPADTFARRLTWAAGGVLLSRLAILGVVLLSNSDGVAAPAILPPLEQAVHAVTAVLLVWALVPHMPHLPRLGDVMLVIILIFTGVMYAFFAQDWYWLISEGTFAGGYNDTQQATVWGIFQLAILVAGLILIVLGRPRDWWLRSFTLMLLFLAHLAHFSGYPVTVAATEIAYWVRLGNLMAFPLVAILAYRHNLAELVAAQLASRPPAEQLADYLSLSRSLIASLDTDRTLRAAVDVAADLVPAPLVAVATRSPDDANHLRLTTSRLPGKNEAPNWGLTLADWPSFRLALQQRQSIELTPNGLGARQLHEFYRELGVGELGALMVTPLIAGQAELGVLLLAAEKGRDYWPGPDKALIPFIAAYVAQAIHNTQTHQQLLRHDSLAGTTAAGNTMAVNNGRILTIEREREEALAEVETLNARLDQTRILLLAEQQRTRDMAASLEAIRQATGDERIVLLEDEIATLREALLEAEEAMALASAGEGGLTPEWVMLTITRYSGELEEAQARIQQLEQEWARRDLQESHDVLLSLVQELRTPLTSIGAYAHLLAGEKSDIIGTKQLSILRRVEANINHMEVLLEQLIQLITASNRPLPSGTEVVDVRETIETAVSNSIIQGGIVHFREKGLRLALDLADSLPPSPAGRDVLYQMLIHLLRYACFTSPLNGALLLSAHADAIEETALDGTVEKFGFLLLSLSITAPTAPADKGHQDAHIEAAPQPHLGNGKDVARGKNTSGGPQAVVAESSPAVEVGESLAALRSLVTAHGGRIWIEARPAWPNAVVQRRVISLLLPLATASATAAAVQDAALSAE
jgi:signal transduction histidine kinase